MENSNLIYQKLESFIIKFYTNKLIKGLIFFIGLGLLYFLFTLLVEYFLWLSPIGRTILFWIFIFVEVLLLFWFILIPIFKLFKLQKGINYKDASTIIGNHFFEINDKLINFLQLSNSSDKSELMLKAIEQRANNLSPIPFSNAINFRGNIKYLPWLIAPLLFFITFMIFGNSDMITQSFGRVVNYNKRFSPPAPFEFIILNKKLITKENQDFILQVKTEGKIIPENVMIFIDKESYYLENIKFGVFEFRFTKPTQNINFYLEANKVSSVDYKLYVLEVPTITNFEMELFFPKYINKKNEIIKGNGNAIVPEGTLIKWKVETVATKQVEWSDFNKNISFLRENNIFSFSKNIIQNIDYQIVTSNNDIKNYEKLNYKISVIKDQFPSINVYNVPDSLNMYKNVVLGQVSDDYGLTKLEIIYYAKNKPEVIMRESIPIKTSNFDQFYYYFPGNLNVEQGISYDYYFEIFDNDAFNHYKSTKSIIFSHYEATDEEKEDEIFKDQNNTINSLSQSIKNQDKQFSDLDKLQNLGKEKSNIEFKDQQKINEFIKRQKVQDEMMKSFSKKMEQNLEQFNAEEKDDLKDKLKERLNNADKEIEKNNKLLDELQDLSNKIKEEELFDKIEKFKQNSKNQTKNLEQLVELTKRYYVKKKTEQLANKLTNLSKKQEDLSNNEKENNSKKQEEINKEFDKLQEDLKDLKKENIALKTPMDISIDKNKEKNIEDDIKKALDDLKQDNKDIAKPKQKSAAKKMKELGKEMSDAMEAAAGEKLEEDIKMLRQILDNLLAFSFSQEDLMSEFKNLKPVSPFYNKNLKIQQNLKQQFKHIDDSLFVMSLRNPSIDELVTKEVGNIHYSIDKSIENLADAMISKGASHQQYTISSANKLADFLSSILGNMQNEIKMQGNPKLGQGKGMQLPDIIKKQEGLGDKMKEAMKKENEKGQAESDKKEKDGKKERGDEKGDNNEGDAKALFEIYKEQQRLKEELQKALEKEGMSGNGKLALDKMKEIEKDLLNKGFKNETLQKMNNLNYELLKLDNAILQQGEDTKRISNTNKNNFNINNKALPVELKEYLNSIEILNRQSLPLRPNYNQKVQQYFKKND